MITKNKIEIIAGELTKYTCQLFIDKEGKKEYFQPFGSGVLFTHNNNYYLLSCAHVLLDDKQSLPYILKSKNEISTIGGEYLTSGLPESNKRKDDKYDFSIVKLNGETIENFINSGHKFLDESFVLTGYEPKEKDLAMCIGYPASRTKVNVQQKTISSKGLKYISRFLKYDLSKDGFDSRIHLLVKYSINNFFNSFSKTVSRGPKPAGLSGGGLWSIFINKKEMVSIKLVGILTEYSENHSVLISTRIDLLIDCIKQNFDPTLVNNGIKVTIT